MQEIHYVLSCILDSYRVINNYPTLLVLMLFLKTLLGLKRASRG